MITLDYGVNDGTGDFTGHVTYDETAGNQITAVDWNNQTQTDWVVRILSGVKPPLNFTVRKGRSGSENRANILAGYVGDPLLIEIGST